MPTMTPSQYEAVLYLVQLTFDLLDIRPGEDDTVSVGDGTCTIWGISFHSTTFAF